MSEPTGPRPQIRGLTCLREEQGIPHARHSWKWGPVERGCPGTPEPTAPRDDHGLISIDNGQPIVLAPADEPASAPRPEGQFWKDLRENLKDPEFRREYVAFSREIAERDETAATRMPGPPSEQWRPGRKVGRTLYIHPDGSETGQLIGMVDTAELATAVCDAMNSRPAPPTATRPQDVPDVPEPPDGRPTADRDAVHRARTDGGVRALLARAMWRRDTQPTTGAQTMGFVYEIADRIATEALPEIERQVRERVADQILGSFGELDPADDYDQGVIDAAKVARGQS
jgi:hypothetical protein